MAAQSKSGGNTVSGTAGADHLNGGAGADDLNGMGGNDRINGGSGNDILDGGAGNDIVSGDSGDDLLVYGLGENAGSTDNYDGGSGRDTLQLTMTRAEWQSPAVQADIARYLAFLAEVTNPVNGQANNRNFTFSSGLTVSKFESLSVIVDGVAFDPRDEAVSLVDDVMSAGEETASISVDVLANDSVPDLIASLTNTQPAHGSVTLTQTVGAPGSADTASFVYTPDAAHWQYLAEGETATDTFTYTVTDSDGDVRTATVTVTITGSNDAPTLGAMVAEGAVIEDAGVGATGVIAFADVDLLDSHSVTSAADGDGYLGLFSAVVADDSTGDGAGSVAWSFSIDDAAIQYLAAGETLIQTYTVSVSDGHGGVVSQPVTVTITGTNDAPVITAADASGGVSETNPVTAPSASSTPVVFEVEGNDTFAAAQVIDRGLLRVAPNANLGDATDASLSIVGAVSAPGAQDVYRIDLSAGELLTLDIDFAAGFGSGSFPGYPAGFGLDSFVFIYDSAGNLLNFNDDAPRTLGGGGSLASQDSYLQFSPTADGVYYVVVKNWDGDGARSAGPYTLQVSVDSQNLQLTDTGVIDFGDVDLADGHTVSVAAQGGDYLGALTATVSDASTGDGAGSVQWNFAVANAAVQFLGAGETRTQTYTVSVADGQGGVATQDVTITITGENDGPVISSAFSLGEVIEGGAESVSGVITFDDVDLIDGHSVSAEAESDNYVGTFTAVINDSATGAGAGEITWTFSASDSELAYLSEGQSLLQRYLVTIDDGNGGTTQQLVNVTIVGTNDAPTITAAVSSASVQEDGVVGATGAIDFADVDLRDGHSVSSTEQGPGYLGVFTATVVDNGFGDGAGSVIWQFEVDNAAIQHLAGGETLIQSYTVSVSDGRGGSVEQVVNVTITGASDGPVAINDFVSALEDQPVTFDVRGNDTDAVAVTQIDGQAISPGGGVALAGGFLQMNGDGTLTYFGAANASGPVSFNYTVVDAFGIEATASTVIDVAAVADAPIIAVGSSTVLNPTVGSAIQTTIHLEAGDVVSFNWDFVAHDYMPYNDFAFASVNGAAYMLGSVQVVGDYGTTGWKTFTFTATEAGDYSFGVGVSNVNDSSLNSHLLVDNLQVNGVTVSSFESGFSGWSTLGSVGVQSGHDGVAPTDGGQMAWLDSSFQSASAIESFLGLTPGRLARIAEATGQQGDEVTVPISMTLGAGESMEDSFVMITGFPAGSTFNFGELDASGGWRVPAGDLGGNLLIDTPDDYSGSFTLTVVGTTYIDETGSSASTAPQTITVSIDPAPGAVAAEAAPLAVSSKDAPEVSPMSDDDAFLMPAADDLEPLVLPSDLEAELDLAGLTPAGGPLAAGEMFLSVSEDGQITFGEDPFAGRPADGDFWN
ncbi:VCBS domain-containing protein [Brevundimonas sp.]|uniref:beta strand repeat-containing protein n=1 Tax=Brevundimonas sp. TaxID=1871086 RepID=UPI002ED8237C